MQGMRLQKVMAHAGLASRRKAERLITQGRVTVNGQVVTTLGTTVDRRRIVVVDGRRLSRRTPLVYVLLHKPRGYITTCDDEQGRPTVFDLLPSADGCFRWAFGRQFRRRVIVDQ
jgi:23S rRNA pseudouridine2605 synthase